MSAKANGMRKRLKPQHVLGAKHITKKDAKLDNSVSKFFSKFASCACLPMMSSPVAKSLTQVIALFTRASALGTRSF